VEVLRAVRRPPRPDEERHDRQLGQPDLLQLRGDLLLLRRVERHLPLVKKTGRLVVGEVLPVTRCGRILPCRDVCVFGEVRVEVPVRGTLGPALPQQGRELGGARTRIPGAPVGLERDIGVDADVAEVPGDDLIRGDPVGPARDDVDVELDRIPLRIDQPTALVSELGVGQKLLRGRWTVGRHLLRQLLHRGVLDPLGEEAAQADRVGRRCVAVLTELRHGLAIDREAERLTERNDAVRVLRRVEYQRDRVGRGRVERVEVLRVLRDVRLLDVRDEVVRPVDLAALDQRECTVVRGRLHILEALDLRLPLLPVARVLAEDVVL
jgi:hypothetical protein